MNQPAQRLCIFCRQLEDGSSECPTLQRLGTTPAPGSHLTLLQPDTVAPLPPTDESLLEHLQKQPSQLCKRCTDYDIVKVFREADPLDLNQQSQLFGTDNPPREDYQQRIAKHEIHTRQLSSFILDASCPLCRLVYRILPRKNLDPRDNMIKLTPYRSHLRVPAWERLPAEMKTQNAILLGVAFPEFAIPTVTPLAAGADYLGPESMTGEAICIAPECAFKGRDRDNFRFITPMVDFSLPQAALDSCIKHCGKLCQADQPPELLTATMIDVEERMTVPCPEHCDYFALSYVWGGVMPAEGALQNRTLPQTIEDAITVTRKLGRRYLWVDALCINQSPTPTPSQSALKIQQLKMMDLIYGCASLTLVAMSGTNSNAGLAGVSPSNPRTTQLKETINGVTFFTVPPTPLAEKDASAWDTRAWTLQEGLLSRRKLYFTPTQMYFQCQRQGIMECFDTSTEMEWPAVQEGGVDGLVRLRGGGGEIDVPPSNPPDWFLHGFLGLLQIYTSRSMTSPSDSLNALLGILSAWERNLLPPSHKFSHGLPLQISPQFLGWMHDKTAGLTPTRRPAFPSWSWAGWEGEVNIDTLLPEGVYAPGKRRRVGDMTVGILGADGGRLRVEGWVVRLGVRTEPFSEVVVGEGEEEKVIGSVKERNFLHNNTLGTGVYECLVVERVRGEILGPGRERVRVFMVVLGRVEGGGCDDGVVERKTMITLTLFAGGDFESTRPVRKVLTLV